MIHVSMRDYVRPSLSCRMLGIWEKNTSLVQICFEEKWLLSDVFVLFYCYFCCCSSPLHLPNTTSNRHFSLGARFGKQFCKSFGIERKKNKKLTSKNEKQGIISIVHPLHVHVFLEGKIVATNGKYVRILGMTRHNRKHTSQWSTVFCVVERLYPQFVI